MARNGLTCQAAIPYGAGPGSEFAGFQIHFARNRIMLNILKNFVREEEGQDLVEYALLLALVVLVVAATLSDLTNAISGVWTNVAGQLGGGE